MWLPPETAPEEIDGWGLAGAGELRPGFLGARGWGFGVSGARVAGGWDLRAAG